MDPWLKCLLFNHGDLIPGPTETTYLSTSAIIEFFLLFSREKFRAFVIARTVSKVVMYHCEWITIDNGEILFILLGQCIDSW